MHALLLNADYRPIKVIPWERALMLLLEEKVDMVADYAGRLIRTVSQAFQMPAVVRLRVYRKPRGRIRFNRQNVLARDGYSCAYCGSRPTRASGIPDIENLTLDHVVPRAQAKGGKVVLPWNRTSVAVTCWENIVTACYACNAKKADRTPQQAGLVLRTIPRAPTQEDILRMALVRVRVPAEWDDYLPEGWRGYWTADLDPS